MWLPAYLSGSRVYVSDLIYEQLLPEMLILVATLKNSHPFLRSIEVGKPSLKTFIAGSLFLLASGTQHECHDYLASLEKYTLPEHPLFRHVLCPHYTSECIIYLSLAIVAAPNGQILNRTVLAVFVFTFVNLAITAESTRVWYSRKFGDKRIKERRKLVPFMY